MREVGAIPICHRAAVSITRDKYIQASGHTVGAQKKKCVTNPRRARMMIKRVREDKLQRTVSGG